MWWEDARKINVFTDAGSQNMQMSSLNEYAKSFDHVIATAMYYEKILKENAYIKAPINDKILRNHSLGFLDLHFHFLFSFIDQFFWFGANNSKGILY